MEVFPAHIRGEGEEKTVQDVLSHNKNVGKLAADRLSAVYMSAVGELLGNLHDIGKMKNEYADYLLHAVNDPTSVRRGSVNHTFAGCRYLLEHFHTDFDPISEILAFSVGSHHGLFDCVNPDHQNGFLHRMTKEDIFYQESLENYFRNQTKEEINVLYQRASQELAAVLDRIGSIPPETADDEIADEEICFYIGLLSRLLLSALIDADRQDTAEFITGKHPPAFPNIEKTWERCLEYLEEKLDRFPKDRPICQARREISDQCAAFAEKSHGVIRLNVPTGGGKTLSALRFALAHAKTKGKSRIILTTSLLSVLDQNAQVIRDYIPDQSLILEHHSNVVLPDETDPDWETMTAQWSAPIIITTLVQLLDTLFSGKTSCIRRFQSLINSVIVLDEAQTVPASMLSLFNLAVNFLSEICGATIVLCSATQPYLEMTDHPLCRTPMDMVPYNKSLWQPFQRTQIINAGQQKLEEIPAFAQMVLEEANSLLIICNKKSESEQIFRALEGPLCFHLSAAMCMAHRQKVLKQMQDALDNKQKLVCVSTQVVEAGVDISFERVIRLTAGMDSIVQSAGRCNRHGESSEPVPVYVIECTNESLTRLSDIQREKDATIALLHSFCGDYSSDEAIRFYYRRLYQSMAEKEQDFVIGNFSLYDLLSENKKYAAENQEPFFLRQAFKTAGALFRVFDQDTVDVVVPFEEGRQICSRLRTISQSGRWDYTEIDSLVQRARLYSVSLYRYQYEKMVNYGAVEELFNGRIRILSDGFYHSSLGFTENQDLLEV